MKLSNLLSTPKNRAAIEEFIHKVVEECRPFLVEKRIAGNLLFRGINATSPILYDKPIRSDRKPKHTPSIISDKVDDYFEQQFGIRFRSNSIFCTANISTASVYGKVYAVYPVGEFKYLWSDKVEDLFLELESILNRHELRIAKLRDPEWVDQHSQEIEEKLKNFKVAIAKLDYKNNELKRALHSGNEIMITGNTYHAINIKDNTIGNVHEIDRAMYKLL